MTMRHWGVMVAAALLASCGGGSGDTSGVALTAAPQSAVATAVQTPAAVPGLLTIAPTPAMTLGAVTHFAQGWDTGVIPAAKTLGVTTVRDGIGWADVESRPGVYDFSSPRVSYTDTLIANGIKPTLLFDGGNPNYDGGYTPYTDAGRAAFAAFIVKTLDRFPAVATIEIGNEYNSNDFVTGPVQQAGYGDRQRYYLAMLKAVYTAVKATHPGVRVLGGAVHSIPVGYLKVLFAAGALNYMDAVVIHPYTTLPEDLPKQVAILRTAMGSTPKPIVASEIDTELDSARDTASYLVKTVSQLAVAGVAEADWYALRQEGAPGNIWYKNAGLLTFGYAPTAAGQAFQLVSQRLLPQGTAQRLPIDETTFAIRFGDKAMVLWGEARSLSLQGSMHVYDVQGQEIAAPGAISPDEPIVIVSDTALTIGGNVVLGQSKLLADSRDQFNYANDQSGPWSYWFDHVATGTLESPYPQFGGEVQSSAWTPYLGNDYLRPFLIASTSLNPVDFGSATAPDIFKPVLRYTMPVAARIDIAGDFTVSAGSLDGVDLTVAINGRVVYSDIVTGHRALALNGIAVSVGDKIDVTVGTNKNPVGDATDYRIKISTE